MSWPAIINGNKSGDLSPETEFLLDCRREGLLCDATVKNGKVLYSVHKVIVAAASPYWESEFEGNSSLPPFATLDVSSENLGDESVSAVLEWIYTGRISAPDWKSLLKIMAAASALKIDCLFSQCQEALVQRLEASNVFSLWFQAERIRHEELGSVCCKYAAIHFPELLRRDRTSVMDLPAEYLKRMLNHDHLSLASEEDVWGIMLEWVLHGEGVAAEDRTQHLPELLSTLRLGLLSERFFREKIVQCDLLSNNLWMKVLLEGKLFYKNAALYKLLRHFSDRSIDKWRQRVPANVALIVESSNNVVGNSSIIVRWFDSRQDKWHVTKPIKEPVLGGSIIYPVMCSSAKTKVIFVLQDMSTLATATKVISVDLLTLAFKELSTLHDFSGTQKLVCVNNDIIVLKYFPNKSFQLYDKSRNQWTGHELEDDDLPIAIGCSVCAVGGKIYLVGGKLLDAQGSYSTIISVYNPDLNKFTLAANLRSPRSRASCCEWEGNLIVAGGCSANDLKSVEVYHPVTREVTSMPPLLKERSDFILTPCDDGLLVIDDWISRKDNVEYFNPRRNRWEKRRSLDLRTHFVLGFASLSSDSVLKAIHNSDVKMDQKENKSFYLR